MANIGQFEVGTIWTKLEDIIGTSVSVGVTYLIQNTGFPSLLLCELPIAPSGDIGFTINKNEKLKYVRNQGSFLWVRAFSNTTTFNIAETTDTDLDSYPFQLKDNLSQDYNNNSEITYPSSKALKNAISDIQQNIGNGVLTLQQNGTTIGTFSANSSESKTINITGGGGECTLQVQVSYNNEVLGNCSVIVDNTTIVTKSNGLATFIGLTKGEKIIEATKSGFLVATDTKQVANSFDFTDIEMTPLTITFTIKDDQNQALVGATVNFNNESKQTDSNGQVVFSQVGIGTKPYTVIMLGYTTLEGTITVEYENETINIIMTSALIVGKAEGTYAAGDTVKLNAGMGLNNYDWTAYPSDTTTTNDLTIEGEVASVETDSLKLTSTPSPEGADITINVDQDDAEIEFNNGDEIDQVNINVIAKDLYLAFIKGADTMYFKNTTLPFIASENTFESKNYIYYTYANGTMSAHTATTSSVTSGGANTYNGVTLNIDTADSFSNGIWIRDNNEDLEIDNGDATIITSSYLTDVNPIIPRTDNFIFSCAKLNPVQWDTKLIIGGQEKQFIDNQEFFVKANQMIEIYATKHNSDKMIDIYNKYFYISNDKHYKKVNFIINVNVNDATIKFTINGVEFEYTGSTANIDCYEGETINWQVSKEGYTTQSDSYSVPSYPTIKSYTQTVNLS